MEKEKRKKANWLIAYLDEFIREEIRYSDLALRSPFFHNSNHCRVLASFRVSQRPSQRFDVNVFASTIDNHQMVSAVNRTLEQVQGRVNALRAR